MASFLLAESGASKTEWRLVEHADVVASFRTSGLNPNNLTEAELKQRVQSEVLAILGYHQPDHLIFYGSGCGLKANVEQMTDLFTDYFSHTRIEVEHDLLGAARACAGDEAGIVCILGTGSNACYYDGIKITQQRGGLGYLLGDEGSGTDLGKRFLRASAHGKWSPEMEQAFDRFFGKSPSAYIREVYGDERPVARLSAVAMFIAEQIHQKEVKLMVEDAFEDFLAQTVGHFPEFLKTPIHFTGSVAIAFQPILIQLCKDCNVKTGNFVNDPIENLLTYHLNHP